MWMLNEAGGATAFDTLGRNHGTITSASHTVTAVGRSLAFTGAGNVSMGDVLDLGTRAFSILCRFRTTTTGATQFLFGKSISTLSPTWELRIISGNTLQFSVRDSSSGFDVVNSASTVTDGAWYTAVVGRPASGGDLMLYLNGVREFTATATNNSLDTDSSHHTRIGRDANDNFPFTGDVSTVGLWDGRLLTNQDALDLYVNPYGIFDRPRTVGFVAAAPGGLSIPIAYNHYRKMWAA